MPELLIQVQEDDAWLKVTTVRYETGHADQKGNRRRAIEQGFLKLADWRASDQFTGRAMRLAEPVGYRKFRVISGVGQ